MKDLSGTVHLSQEGSETGSFCYTQRPQQCNNHRFFPADVWTALLWVCHKNLSQGTGWSPQLNLWTGGWGGAFEFCAPNTMKVIA